MDKNAGNISERRRVFNCLSALLFPALGFIVGVFLSMFLPSGGWWGLAAKLLMVCYSLLGWAIGVCFIQQKRLYCGATQTLNSDEFSKYIKRYGVGAGIVFAGFMLSTIGILGAANAKASSASQFYGFLVYFFSLPTTFSILVGEVGWEDPWKFFKKIADIRKK
jgi:hypothetical protein